MGVWSPRRGRRADSCVIPYGVFTHSILLVTSCRTDGLALGLNRRVFDVLGSGVEPGNNNCVAQTRKNLSSVAT